MTPAARGATSPWGGDAWGSPTVDDADGIDDSFVDGHQLLGDDTSNNHHWDSPTGADPHRDSPAGAAQDWSAAAWDDPAPTAQMAEWTEVDSSAAAGLSGRGLILLTGLAAGACTLLDLALTGGRMTFFFDLCFVVICLVATMAVRRDDLFTAGVLPPLLFAVVIGVVAVAMPDALDSSSGVVKVFLSGLAGHAAGLVGGYCVALLCVAARSATSDTRRR